MSEETKACPTACPECGCAAARVSYEEIDGERTGEWIVYMGCGSMAFSTSDMLSQNQACKAFCERLSRLRALADKLAEAAEYAREAIGDCVPLAHSRFGYRDLECLEDLLEKALSAYRQGSQP